MAYGTSVILKNRSGERKIPIEDFIKGPGATSREPDEILTEFQIDIPGPLSGAGYLNLGIRKAQDCNIVNVASFISLDKDDIIRSARIAMGCVGPTQLRAPSAESLLQGQKASEELFAEAGQLAMKDSQPITDFRAAGDYKMEMVSVLTRRTLAMAFDEAKTRKK